MREAFYRIIAYDEAEDAAPTPSHGSGSGKAKSSHKKGDGVLLSFSFVLEKTTFELSKQEEETEVYSPLLRMNCTHLAVGAFVRESLDSALVRWPNLVVFLGEEYIHARYDYFPLYTCFNNCSIHNAKD